MYTVYNSDCLYSLYIFLCYVNIHNYNYYYDWIVHISFPSPSVDIDYSALTDHPLLFFPDVYTDCVNVTILDNDVLVGEPDQSFIVSLTSNDPVSFPVIQSASITIQDDDGEKNEL